MLTKTTVATWLLALAAAAGCQNASHPVHREPTVKVISVERLGDAPEHPTTSEQAQARRYDPVIPRRAPTTRFDVPARDKARTEPGSTAAWPPAREDELEGEGAGASPFSETASGHGTTTNTGVNTENQGNAGTDDPRR